MKEPLFLGKNENFHWTLSHLLQFLILYNLVEALRKLLSLALDFSVENIVESVMLVLIAYSTLLILNNRVKGVYLCVIFHVIDACLRYFVFLDDTNWVQFSIYLAIGLLINLGCLSIRKDGVAAWHYLK